MYFFFRCLICDATGEVITLAEKDRALYTERRKFPRREDNIFISYRFKSRVFKAITQNICGGGLMFGAEKKIPSGSELELEICQPANRFKSLIFVIPVSIKVMWARRIKYGFLEEGENKYMVGARFTKIEDEGREKILRYVEAENSR